MSDIGEEVAAAEEPQQNPNEEREFLITLGVLPNSSRKELRRAVEAYRLRFLDGKPMNLCPSWRRMRVMLAEANGLPILKVLPPARSKRVPKEEREEKPPYVNRPTGRR
jgi:hypothetical protein